MPLLRDWRTAFFLALALFPGLVWLQWVGPRFFVAAQFEQTAALVRFRDAAFVSLVITGAVIAALPRLMRLLSASGVAAHIAAGCAVLSGTLAVVCLAAAALGPAGERPHSLRLLAGVLAGISAAFGTALARGTLDRIFERRWAYHIATVVAALSLAAGIHWCGLRQFGGFDHSIVVDFGWRLISGQQPFTDFPVTAPPGFFLGAYYAYAAFGVSWHALVLGIATFSGVTFFWSLWLLAQFIESRWIRFVIAFAMQALCILTVSYWWYNPITTTSGILFSLAAYAWLRCPSRVGLQFSYCASLFLLASTKPNVAAPLIIVVTAVLLTSREHRIRVIVLSMLTFGAFVLWLSLHDISVIDTVRGYRGVAKQGLKPGPFFDNSKRFEVSVALITLFYVLLPLAVCLSCVALMLRQWRAAAIGLGCVAAGLSNFVSAGETKLVDTGIVLIGVALVAYASGAWQPSAHARVSQWNRLLSAYLAGIMIILSSAAVAVAFTRHRVHGIGENLFFEYALKREPFPDGYFRGLRTGRLFEDTYAQVRAEVIGAGRTRIFFGPRMQWGYAAVGLPSPVGPPVWWHGGVAFPHEHMPIYVDRFVEQQHDLLIYLKDDMTYYPPELMAAIQRDYVQDQRHSQLTVFRRRSPGASASGATLD